MTTKKPKASIRAPSGNALNAFVASGTTASVDQSTTRPSGKRAKGLVQRVTKGELDRVTAYLPADLGYELRMRCTSKRIELSEAIADAVRRWIDGPGA